MRLTIFLFLLPFLLGAQADLEYTSGINWQTNYNDALAIANKENKNILVYFTGSDWCHPCKMLKRDFFDTESFKDLAANYTLLYVDLPRNKNLLTTAQITHNKNLLSTLNKKGVFPLLKVLNPDGKELGEYAGYRMDGEISHHVALLDKHKVVK